MLHDFIIWNNGNVDQRKITSIKLLGKLGITKLIQPAHGIRVRCDLTMVEQQRDDQRQLLITGVKVALHGGDSVAYQSEGHVFVW
ncbi:hypothetical protein D3C71_1749500 [compost metagenome]